MFFQFSVTLFYSSHIVVFCWGSFFLLFFTLSAHIMNLVLRGCGCGCAWDVCAGLAISRFFPFPLHILETGGRLMHGLALNWLVLGGYATLDQRGEGKDCKKKK